MRPIVTPPRRAFPIFPPQLVLQVELAVVLRYRLTNIEIATVGVFTDLFNVSEVGLLG